MLSAFTHGTVLLPNDDALPTANASTECFEENLLPNGVLPNSAHMSISSLYQFFGVNTLLSYCHYVKVFVTRPMMDTAY
jgi:hypothetical protein